MATKPTHKTPDFPTLPSIKDFDFSKLFGDMKVPPMPDMEAVLSAHKRNLEALSEANRVALEGAQAVARRHMEIMQSTMSGLTATLKELSVSESPATTVTVGARVVSRASDASPVRRSIEPRMPVVTPLPDPADTLPATTRVGWAGVGSLAAVVDPQVGASP